jgi:hypothetical protein
MDTSKLKLNYDQYAVELADGSYLGPFKTWGQATVSKAHNRGVCIIKCTGIGELQPDTHSDGTVTDRGTIGNPKRQEVSVKKEDTVGQPIINEPVRESGQVTYTAKHAEVDADAAERVKRHEEHVTKFGIAMAPPIYAPGFVTEKLGGENFHLSHKEHREMPMTVEGLQGIKDAVRAEKRLDLTLHPQRLRMLPNGLLYRVDGAKNPDGTPRTIVLEGNGLRQLCARMTDQFPRAAEFLSVLDPADRAEVFNKQIVKVDPDYEFKARTRLSANGMRSVYAVVGKTYSTFDADRIAEVLSDPFREMQIEFGENAPRGLALYQPDDSSMRVDAIWHADSIVNLAAGDVFKAGLRFRSSDTGGGSIKADLLVWRNLCKNLIIIDNASVEVMRKSHRGSMDGVVVDLTSATAKAQDLVQGFAKDWGFLRRTPITKVQIFGEQYKDVYTAINALLDAGRIDGMTATNATVQALLASRNAEPGNESLADVINIITRAAHEGKFGIDKQEKIERAAGELVPVLVKAAHRAMD